MKKYLNFIKFTTLLLAIFLGSMNVTGANKPHLISKDYSTQTMKFFTADTIVIVIADTCSFSVTDRLDMENAVYWENDQNRPVYVYKSEKEVVEADCKKHILFYGCFNKFQRKEFLGIPVRKYEKGFKFESRTFTDPADAFFYVNKKANRMYLCKNSDKIQHQFFNVGATGYPLHIFRGSDIVLTGVY
jgi:hypothetical protein